MLLENLRNEFINCKRLAKKKAGTTTATVIPLCSTLFLIAAFKSAREKKVWLRRAAIIHVEIFPTVPSAEALSFGVRTRAGIAAVP